MNIAGSGVIPFAPPDKQALYKSYMPFIKNGGLYISTTKKYEIGSEVFILVKLPENSTKSDNTEKESGGERLSAVGKVVWVNKNGAVLKPAGIGVQLTDTPENAQVREKIETILLGMSQDSPTFTM